MNVGDIIHKLRKEKKMTLLELSNNSGVALATLSRVENGKMTGTLDSHIKIAEALEASLPELYKDLTDSKKHVEIHERKNQSDIFVHDKHATSEMLVTKALNKKMMPVIVKIQRGGMTHKEETRPGVEKFIYILEGKIEAAIGTVKYALTKGDSLYFESSLTHHFKNTGTGETRLMCVSSPPGL